MRCVRLRVLQSYADATAHQRDAQQLFSGHVDGVGAQRPHS